MLARFRPDVIELKPDYAVILAVINDIARNTGYITVEHTFGNLVSLVELAPQTAGHIGQMKKNDYIWGHTPS